MKICCFTGHRTVTPDCRAPLAARLHKTLLHLISEGFTDFRTGGARGFDTMAAACVLALREQHPHLRLHLILPCRDQAKTWREGERLLWQEMINKADTVRFLQDAYTPGCMHARNRALVDGSDLCVAYLTENCGGTLYTCSYALKQGVQLLNLADEL